MLPTASDARHLRDAEREDHHPAGPPRKETWTVKMRLRLERGAARCETIGILYFPEAIALRYSHPLSVFFLLKKWYKRKTRRESRQEDEVAAVTC